MSTQPAGAATQAAPLFTPSELVVLHGDRFSEPAGMLGWKEEVMTTGTKVSAEKLGIAAMAAALLANERAGHLTLELRMKKALFGLTSKQVLHAVPGAPPAWPEGSFEAAVARASAGSPGVTELYRAVIAQEADNAYARVIALIKAGLAQRGLLEVEEGKVLKVFTTTKLTLPERTRAAAEAASPEAVEELLRNAECDQPELWKVMTREIRAAATWMTKSND